MWVLRHPSTLALNLHQRVQCCLIQDEHQVGQDAIFLMMDISGNSIPFFHFVFWELESVTSLYQANSKNCMTDDKK